MRLQFKEQHKIKKEGLTKMKIVLLLSGRGGQSKTNIAYSLAHIADRNGQKVGLLDLDTNQSLYLKIAEDRKTYEEAGHIKNKIKYKVGHLSFSESDLKNPTLIHQKILDFAGDIDLLVIDSYGHLSKMHTHILPMADIIIIPTVSEISAIKSAVQAYALVNNQLSGILKEYDSITVDDLPLVYMVKTRWTGKLARKLDMEISEMSLEYNFEILKTYTTEFPSQYKLADYFALPITELPENLSGKEFEAAEKAEIQMKVLVKEILRKIGIETKSKI